MTCPTILIQPVIRVTEVEPYGDVITHWDEPVTRYAIVMVGDAMHDVALTNDDGDPTGEHAMLSMRHPIAGRIVMAGGLIGAQAAALLASAIDDPAVTLPLEDALAVHRAATRWAADGYSAWAEWLAGGSDTRARAA